ncbi:MAG TPA: restriction endonuclease [Verrucomicrobiae bacterium]
MLIKQRKDILAPGNVLDQQWFQSICREVEIAIESVIHPAGTSTFRINPVRQGNGVIPIKQNFVKCLKEKYGWELESRLEISSSGKNAGKIDAVKAIPGTGKYFAVEWETGNISSSHRALNKIALGIISGKLVGGALIVPSRKLYEYLTDRIGNYAEMEPYFPVWGNLKVKGECIISVFEIEHDSEDSSLPLISKGKDGMARGLLASRKKRLRKSRP